MKTSNGRMAPVAFALFITVVAVVLAGSGRGFNVEFWRVQELNVLSMGLRLSYYVVPPLLFAAVVYYFMGSRAVFIAALIAVGVNAVTLMIRVFLQRPGYALDRSFVDYLIDIPQVFTNWWSVMPAIALVSFRFRDKWDRWRIAVLLLLPAVPACGVASFWLHGELFYLVQMLLIILYLVALAPCVWCIIFRQQDVVNRPPVDSARVIALTCPRCGTAQNIAAGHGECGNCRLKISISLEEGVCGHCRYPLRGLTGEKCPECGKAIAIVKDQGFLDSGLNKTALE